jgi:hypothetical protein
VGTTRRVLTVFVGSPGDVAQEREALASVASRVNRVTGRDWGWEIDLRGWEDTLPGYARPQALINPDVDACDVFIGVLWKRWGQPTGTHSSGFEEEIERAIERNVSTGAPEIMLYFRDVDGDAERDAGPQLQRVLQFRDSVVKSRSMLYRSYGDVVEFDALLFEHLMKVLGRHATEAAATSGADLAEPSTRLLTDAQEPPEATTVLGLACDPLMTPTRLRDRWKQAEDEVEIPLLPCAVGPRGLFRFNIFDPAQSATLLVGMTGSGKTEALMAIAASLALSIPPDMLRISFFDLKSNSYARALEELGANAGSPVVEPDTAFDVLMDEIQRRERLLVASHARDAVELWRRNPSYRREMPAWLVCIDEISGLLRWQTNSIEQVVTAARHARALGIHVLFGSQIIAGVGAGVRSLCTRRICLRMFDPADSIDVVGVPEATMLARNAPGMAIVREGSDPPRAVRFAALDDDGHRLGSLLSEARQGLTA